MKRKSTYKLLLLLLFVSGLGALNAQSKLTIAHDFMQSSNVFMKDFKQRDSALFYANKAYKIYEQEGLLSESYFALSQMGKIALFLQKIEEGILYLKMCELMLQNHKDSIANRMWKRSKFETYLTLARHYRDESPALHLFYLQKGIKETKKIDDKEALCRFYQNYMYYYNTSNQYQKAFEYAQKNQRLALQIGDTNKIGIALVDLGDLLTKMGKYEEANDSLNKAEEWFELKKTPSSYCFPCWNLTAKGHNYLKWGKYGLAEEKLLAALDTFSTLGYSEGVTHSKARLSRLYYLTGRNEKARKFTREALKSKGEGSLVTHINFIKSLIKLYEIVGLEDSARTLKDKLAIYNDSIMSLNIERQIKALRKLDKVKLEQNELEANQMSQEQEIQENKARRGQLLVIGIIVVVLILVTYLGLRNKILYSAKLKEKKEVTEWQKVMLEDQLLTAKEQQHEIQLLHAELTNRMVFAQNIQLSILPHEQNFKKTFPDSFTLYLPRDIVSGDFYWMNEVEENTLFAVVDCTGHGVPGALVSMVGSNGLNTCVKDYQLEEPAQILDKLTEIIERSFKSDGKSLNDGMDVALCSINKAKTELQYSGANNPLWILRDGELIEYKADKQPIGKFEHRKPFTNHTIPLQPNDRIYIFSDGYADQFGGLKNKKFKTRNFKRFLLEIEELPMDKQFTKILEKFTYWKGNYEQVDDVCVMGIKV